MLGAGFGSRAIKNIGIYDLDKINARFEKIKIGWVYAARCQNRTFCLRAPSCPKLRIWQLLEIIVTIEFKACLH